ncbi:ABC-2 type transport system permease protein [Actinoplanes octamycinicus]|uniref:ABC-2 type transport system permease protein n=1 Tax=Actinoplanes octamycinicus TaxID=135948 RepID=A0A7W7GYU6_9ACTN|nr:hypothetical protein [Actinoplanes octamycinicus]MBB4740742.1 ABC-2 type transport system permease protein [Actinoplanes octamycinicus]GIE61720.1 hypothetical protein Aoc01nite_71220 [Actinoplanes octamycinicus]
MTATIDAAPASTPPAAAVATLVRMRATMLRRALRENPAPLVAAVAGLLAAAWLIRYAVRGNPHTLGILAGAWVLGWIVLPLLLGGTRGRLRPTQLRLEPITPGPMTAGLLAASAVGIGPAVSLLALAALPVHAAVQHGFRAAVLAAVGALLLWLVGLTGSAVAVEAVGRAAGPVGAILTGTFTGAVMGVTGSVWAVAPWIGTLLVTGPPPSVVEVLARVPSDWPLAAAAAAPGAAAGLLAGLAGLVGALLAGYGVQVRRVVSAGTPFRRRRGAGRGSEGTPGRTTARPRHPVPGPLRAVAVRELISWVRHPLRLQYLTFAVVYGSLLALLPLLAHVDLLAPWAGPLAVLWASAMAASLVGLDGTALWIPLLTPSGEAAETRGRALAWLLLALPVGLLLTVAGILVAPGVDPLPAIAVLPALLGAGATTPVWVALLRVRPVRDARHPTAADNPTDIVSVLLALAGPLVAAAPAFALAVWGPDGLRWLAPVAGLLTGFAVGRGALWLADDRLAQRGTEVLAAAGDRSAPPPPAVPLTWDPGWYRENRATAWALVLLTVGWLPVLPQGLLVLVLDVHGGWIVASHLTGGVRTGVALGMVALGAGMLLTGLVLWGRRPLR